MAPAAPAPLSATDLEHLLEVTRALAAPFELHPMLATVTAAAKQVLRAERSSVWLFDAERNELVLEVAQDLGAIRLPVGRGLVGQCARDRAMINVPDCYADPRFDPSADKRSGFVTRCSLSLPLIDHTGALVGVMQVLNRAGGVFDAADERLAQALAAQCAVALQRVRLTQAQIEGERLRQELDVARAVQASSLPAVMPMVPGYDCHGLSRPATQTGGDTFDLALTPQGLLVMLGDATGHGIGPALAVTQMHAMLRMAMRLGAPLPQAVMELNNALAETMAEDRFITAFIGLLDPATHGVQYLSAGQGPVLQFHAATGEFTEHRPTGLPLAVMPQPAAKPPKAFVLQPGDVLVLLSDGIYEQPTADGTMFGRERVEAVVRDEARGGMVRLAERLLTSVQAFAQGAPQDDDISVVLLRRHAPERTLEVLRETASLAALFDFSRGFCAAAEVPDEVRSKLDFVLEELFTNLVKYSASAEPVPVTLTVFNGVVQLELLDRGGSPFDPAAAPDVDTTLPADQREPGGLGLHLIKRLADSIEHRQMDSTKTSLTTCRFAWPC